MAGEEVVFDDDDLFGDNSVESICCSSDDEIIVAKKREKKEKPPVIIRGRYSIKSVDEGFGGRFAILGKTVKEQKPARVRLPAELLPSLSPYLAFEMTLDIAKSPPMLISIDDIQPLPITVKMVKPFGRATGKAADVVMQHELPPSARAAMGIAFHRPAFYQLLRHFPASLLEKISDADHKMILKMRDDPCFALWEGIRTKMPHLPAANDVVAPRNFPCPPAAAAAWQAVRAHYAATASTYTPGVESPLIELGIVSPQGGIVAVETAEARLLSLLSDKITLIHCQSMDADYGQAIVECDADVVVAPGEHMVADLVAQGIKRRVAPISEAVAAVAGKKSVVIAAAHLATMRELIAILGITSLMHIYLIGDAQHITAIAERPDAYMHGFALLCLNRQVQRKVEWPTHIARDSDQMIRCWQREHRAAILAGRTQRLFVNVGMASWDQLQALHTRAKTARLFLFYRAEHRDAAIAASSGTESATIAPRACLYLPEAGVWGTVKRCTDRDFVISGRTFKMPQTVYPGRYEMISRYIGTPAFAVVVVVDETTPRTVIASALKFATDEFTIVFAPDSSVKELARLPLLPSVHRSQRVNEHELHRILETTSS